MNQCEIKLNKTEYVDIKYNEINNDLNSTTILISEELSYVGILRDAYIKTPEGEKKYTRKINDTEEWDTTLKAIEIWESSHNVPA